jgi:hypothetical protein
MQFHNDQPNINGFNFGVDTVFNNVSHEIASVIPPSSSFFLLSTGDNFLLSTGDKLLLGG